MGFLRRGAAVLAASALCGCSTTVVPLGYTPPRGVARAEPALALVSVGTFQDGRNISYGGDWLGAVRSGYGDPMKKLRTERPIAEVVQAAFAEGLRARGVYAEPGQGPRTLEGTLGKLDCSEYRNREAHVHLEVRVLDSASHALLFSKLYAVDKTQAAFGAHLFGSVEKLDELANRALGQLVDDALDDPQLRSAVQAR